MSFSMSSASAMGDITSQKNADNEIDPQSITSQSESEQSLTDNSIEEQMKPTKGENRFIPFRKTPPTVQTKGFSELVDDDSNRNENYSDDSSGKKTGGKMDNRQSFMKGATANFDELMFGEMIENVDTKKLTP